MDGWADGWVNEWINELMNEWVNEPEKKFPFFAGVVGKIIRARAIKNRRVFASKTRKPLSMALNRRAGGFALKVPNFFFALTREN